MEIHKVKDGSGLGFRVMGGAALAAPRNPQQCVAAYSRIVAFKKQIFGLNPIAIPTPGESLPHIMAQHDQFGSTVHMGDIFV